MFLDKLKLAHSRSEFCIRSFLSSTWLQNVILLPCFTVAKAVKYAVLYVHQNTSDATQNKEQKGNISALLDKRHHYSSVFT